MGAHTSYCPISGCTPHVATTLTRPFDTTYGPIVKSAVKALADEHELSSQDDISLIGPIHPSGQPYEEGLQDGVLSNDAVSTYEFDLNPETDIRVLPHCVMGRSWESRCVAPPLALKKHWRWEYSVGSGSTVMVQTFALDILALATHGQMTPLRFWRLAMEEQGLGSLTEGFEHVDYGKIAEQWEQTLDDFPGFTKRLLSKLEEIGDVEVAKERLMFDGLLWLWIAPDRFPVSAFEDKQYLWLPKVEPSASRSTIETLPTEVLTRIIALLPLKSLLDFVGTSRWLYTGILGDDYMACVWMYNNAPWWIPVPTQTPENRMSKNPLGGPWAFPASEWSAHIPLTTGFPIGVGWAYVWRCMRSGSMQNRKRIWELALLIECLADDAGV